MPICDDLRLVFIHIPKNAGTAIEKGGAMRETGHKPWHVYATQFPVEWGAYKSFAVVRDPVDRFLSCYRYARMERSYWHSSVPGETAVYGRHPDYDVATRYCLGEFVEKWKAGCFSLRHPGWRPQAFWVCQGPSVMVDELLRYEDIEAGVRKLGLPALPVLNVSAGTSNCEVDSNTRDSIASIYRTDYEVLGLPG